jgi:hypothetical protein
LVAAGASPVIVLHEGETSERQPFFIYVGREEEPCRIRRVAFQYDQMEVLFRSPTGEVVLNP